MKLRNAFLILICILCIVLTGWAFYLEGLTLDHTIETSSSTQESLPGIVRLDAFNIPFDEMGTPQIIIIHDNKRNVTCYIFKRFTYGGGISCIPDSEIQSSEIDNNYKRYIAR